jgi:flagellar hook-basal body complex protein FliE
MLSRGNKDVGDLSKEITSATSRISFEKEILNFAKSVQDCSKQTKHTAEYLETKNRNDLNDSLAKKNKLEKDLYTRYHITVDQIESLNYNDLPRSEKRLIDS